MKNKVWKRLFMGSLMISAVAVPAQTTVRIQAEEETAALAENETDFQMLFDEAVKDAMIIDADEVLGFNNISNFLDPLSLSLS